MHRRPAALSTHTAYLKECFFLPWEADTNVARTKSNLGATGRRQSFLLGVGHSAGHCSTERRARASTFITPTSSLCMNSISNTNGHLQVDNERQWNPSLVHTPPVDTFLLWTLLNLIAMIFFYFTNKTFDPIVDALHICTVHTYCNC